MRTGFILAIADRLWTVHVVQPGTMRFYDSFKILVTIRQAVQFALGATLLILFLHVAWEFTSTEPYDRTSYNYVIVRDRLQVSPGAIARQSFQPLYNSSS